ncbi:hypothetical protein ACWJJH_02785 [Endozoicomonadaceae bacterium StTr2]
MDTLAPSPVKQPKNDSHPYDNHQTDDQYDDVQDYDNEPTANGMAVASQKDTPEKDIAMENAQWKELVSSVAPTLAGMLGGPLAGVAVSMLAETLLDDPQATEDDIATTLSAARVEDLNKLKNLDKDVRVQLRELGIREQQLVYDDKKDARNRQMQLKDRMPGILSVLLTLGFFLVLTAMILGHADPNNEAVLQVMLGALSTAWIGSMQFFFGTTQSSRDKNQMLRR